MPRSKLPKTNASKVQQFHHAEVAIFCAGWTAQCHPFFTGCSIVTFRSISASRAAYYWHMSSRDGSGAMRSFRKILSALTFARPSFAVGFQALEIFRSYFVLCCCCYHVLGCLLSIPSFVKTKGRIGTTLKFTDPHLQADLFITMHTTVASFVLHGHQLFRWGLLTHVPVDVLKQSSHNDRRAQSVGTQ